MPPKKRVFPNNIEKMTLKSTILNKNKNKTFVISKILM